jgi:hypothetical protein
MMFGTLTRPGVGDDCGAECKSSDWMLKDVVWVMIVAHNVTGRTILPMYMATCEYVAPF